MIVILCTAMLSFVLVFIVIFSSILLFSGCLIGALLLAAFFAALSSVSLVAGYAFLRLTVHFRASGFGGVGPWVYEMQAILINGQEAEMSKEAVPAQLEEYKGDDLENSDISLVSHPAVKQEGSPIE
jgi:hypothetical protein